MRRPIVAGNWKMNKTSAEGGELAAGVAGGTDGMQGAEVVLCPPYTALQAVAVAVAGTGIALGAQNVHGESSGAYTGEVSAAMLRELGCAYVIAGHSERRAQFGETDEMVNLKARAVLDAGMRPIVCVGETLEQREAGRTSDVVRTQVENSLRDLGSALAEVVVAYEPVWAIGTGRTATTEQAQEVHALIRATLASMAGAEIAAGLRIQYGGSVKPDNAAELFAQPDVDGGLIGGASLEAGSFLRIVEAATVRPLAG